MELISYLAVAVTLITYALKREYFDLANLILFIPVCLPALLAGAYPSVIISVSFGLIGGYNVIRRK